MRALCIFICLVLFVGCSGEEEITGQNQPKSGNEMKSEDKLKSSRSKSKEEIEKELQGMEKFFENLEKAANGQQQSPNRESGLGGFGIQSSKGKEK